MQLYLYAQALMDGVTGAWNKCSGRDIEAELVMEASMAQLYPDVECS